ncbi:MAG TPA: hypothetical protein VEY07_06120 [Thermoplasmata archaeon]|nr:hypothetical protein [Thermoplasmata archaeon]
MTPLPAPLRGLMAIVVGVSIPEGLSLLFGPPEWYSTIWGWQVTVLSARFIAGIYLSVSLGFILAWREGTWEGARIPLAMLWSFALVALASASLTNALGQGSVLLARPFTWVWVFLYVVSVVGGLYYHLTYPRPREHAQMSSSSG